LLSLDPQKAKSNAIVDDTSIWSAKMPGVLTPRQVVEDVSLTNLLFSVSGMQMNASMVR